MNSAWFYNLSNYLVRSLVETPTPAIAKPDRVMRTIDLHSRGLLEHSTGVYRAFGVLRGMLECMTTVAHASLADEITRVSRLGNLTAEHLAAAAGGDPSGARRWLHGTRTPRPGSMRPRLCN